MTPGPSESRPKAYVRMLDRNDMSDVDTVIRDLRQADIQEAMALGFSPAAAIKASVSGSTAVYTIMEGERPVGLFGVGPMDLPSMPGMKVGCVWMVGTPGITRISGTFLRQSKHWADLLHNYYPVLWNWASASNTVHIRWLKWLGFKIIGLGPRGPRAFPSTNS